jgi:amino acid transporter
MSSTATTAAPSRSRRRPLSTVWIFLLVVSAASPLTSVVGVTALGFSRGNGAGLPAAYALMALVMICFAVGYAAISRRLINTGAFYTYVARGIGRPPAIGVGLVAVIAYVVDVAGIVGSGGYFLKLALKDSQVDINWFWGSAVLLVLVGVMGYRGLRVNAAVLGVLTIAGTLVMAVFDILVIADKGAGAFPSASFNPSVVLSGSPGLAALFALTCFVGVETAALYSEETRDPQRTVPKAIFLAFGFLGVYYVLSLWILVGSIGPDALTNLSPDQLGSLVFDQMFAYGGDGLRTVAALLFLGATLAGALAFHNAASRYLFVLGRDRVLPAWLGQRHPDHRGPSRASLVVTTAMTVIVVGAFVLRLDPLKALALGAIGLATLGVVGLQAFAAAGIVVFFWRRGQGNLMSTIILPGLAALALAFATVFELLNFGTLVQSSSPLVIALPWIFVAAMVVGVVTGMVIRTRKPARYARLAESRLRPEARRLTRPRHWTRRYCLIGAGPAGLAMARRLSEEGVPFDWFESHHDIGGLWHADRPGGPGYDSLIAATSRFTSGFPDFPMPADFPDYPRWWQVRDYLRGYAATFGLYDLVSLNTAVTWVKPDGIGWSVTLSTGGVHYYSGIIVAAGRSLTPRLPFWPGERTFHGEIWHSARYRSPADLAGRRVLVVGAGNTAVEIACDAARTAMTAALSVRSGHRYVPRYLDGVPTDAVLAEVLEPPGSVTLPPDPTEVVATLAGDVRQLGLPAAGETPPSHPTITEDLLPFLSQGWIGARPDVAEILPDGVRYVDGTAEPIDLIIAATGYEPKFPFLDADLYLEPDGRSGLYLNLFSRRHDGLVVMGLSEFGGAVFPRLDDMARAVVVELTLRELGGVGRRAWLATKANDRPDLSGGRQFPQSTGSAFLVDDHAYEVLLRDMADRFGYAPPSSVTATPPAPAPALM